MRIPRRALNKVAERLKIPAAVLLRRLIAAQIEPSERTRAAPHILPLLTTAVPVKTARIVPLVKSALQLAAAAASSSITRELKAQEGRKRLRIVSTVGRHRSLGEIGEAMRRSEGITDEELIRWRAVYAGK